MTATVRKWFLGTVIGGLLLSVLGSVFFESIRYCCFALMGRQPLPDIQLFSNDGIQLGNTPVKASYHELLPDFPNGLRFPISIRNNGIAIKPPLYIDIYIPKSLSISPATKLEPSPFSEFQGREKFVFDNPNFGMPGGGYSRTSTIFFWLGSGAPKPVGKHTIRIAIYSDTTQLYEKDVRIKIQ